MRHQPFVSQHLAAAALLLSACAAEDDKGGAGSDPGVAQASGEGEGEPGGEGGIADLGEGEGEGGGEGEGEPQGGQEVPGSGEGEGESPAGIGATRHVPYEGAVTHEDEGTPIDYDSVPPAAGSHYRAWTPWGESQEALDPRSWVHNLEHGGVAFLYNCAEPCPDLVDAARAYAQSKPADDGGDFRWVLTPYTGMDHRLAVVAWEWIYEADVWDAPSVEAFVAEHYRKGPEDVAAPPPDNH